MARYVDQALSPGEKILYDAKVHWAIFISPVVMLAVCVFLLIMFLSVQFIPVELSGKFGENIRKHDIDIGFVPMFFPFIIIFVGGAALIKALIYYFNSDFVLTDRRVLSKFGLLSRTTSEQRLTKVESIHVYQSLLGRLLGFGTVTVTGTGSSRTHFGPMVDPIGCKRAIEGQLDAIRDLPAARE